MGALRVAEAIAAAVLFGFAALAVFRVLMFITMALLGIHYFENRRNRGRKSSS